jgi:hypothetical protein
MIEFVLLLVAAQRFYVYAAANGYRRWTWALLGGSFFFSGWLFMIHVVGPLSFEMHEISAFVNNYSGLELLLLSIISGCGFAVGGFILCKKSGFFPVAD